MKLSDQAKTFCWRSFICLWERVHTKYNELLSIFLLKCKRSNMFGKASWLYGVLFKTWQFYISDERLVVQKFQNNLRTFHVQTLKRRNDLYIVKWTTKHLSLAFQHKFLLKHKENLIKGHFTRSLEKKTCGWHALENSNLSGEWDN